MVLQLAAIPWRLVDRIVRGYYRGKLTEAVAMLEYDSSRLAETLIELMKDCENHP